jgi:hypothetical protein
MTEDGSIQSALSILSFKGASLEENLRSMPPATKTLEEIKGHPWKLKR